MALDLFANFERASNNSLFYRPVSSVPHDIVFKLAEEEQSGVDLVDLYQAEYSINGSARLPMIDLQSCQQFARSAPTNYTFTAYISSLDPLKEVGTIAITAKYVSSIPEADFIVYPTYAFNEDAGTVTELNSTNYTQSSGTYFYGEGHTERVNLSSNSSTANWYIGNPLSAIEDNQSYNTVTAVNTKTAYVDLTSSPALEKSYEVSLRVTGSGIDLTGPIYTYDDSTGERSFYPFFTSTLHISNSASELNNYLRGPIEIRQYPIVENYSLISQLSGFPTKVSLPYNYNYQRFLASIKEVPVTSFLTESLYATQWEVESVADTQEPNPDWSSITSTYPLITAYSFPLSYYNQNNVDDILWRCSAGFDTTVTTTVSVYKSTVIDFFPNDWLCRTTALPISDIQIVAGMPVGRFYTSNYYYLTGEEIKVYNITEDRSNITVTSVVLSSDRLASSVSFQQKEYKTISFDDIGTVTLSATINFIDNTGFPRSITTIIEDFIEIVSEYDQVEPDSYRSIESSPSTLVDSYPRITPNEWVTEDNINSIFVKFNDALSELRTYARQYNTTNEIIGRLEPTPDPQGSCLGKYCLDWKWSARKCANSTKYTTWLNTKCSGEYSATWANEECPLLSQLDCGRDANWLVPTIEPLDFNDWTCITEDEECKYTSIAKLNNQDKLIVSYKTELHLLDSNYEATTLEKCFFIDEVFKFINIVGIASTTDDRICVLDSTLSRVSVFSIDETNKFVLFSTWGRYGLSNSKTGFNKPQDIHVDEFNNVWICDTGNECVKKLTTTGRHIATVQNALFEDNAPISICTDSDGNLHCLTEDSKIYVFDSEGAFSFSYSLPEGIIATKINSSYNKEAIHVAYNEGIIKYFKTGVFSHYIIQDYQCSADGSVLEKFSSIVHDRYRNIYVTLNNVILKIVDRMTIDELSYEAYAANSLWSLDSILIDKEEYIQPWVYLRSFHRLWDNIELFRNSLFYETEGCKSFTLPFYDKEDLKLGQNEIVTNAVINRLSEQLWTNLQSIAKYFDPTCKN